MKCGQSKRWFAWYPVRVYAVVGKVLVFHRWAWLEYVQKTRTWFEGIKCFDLPSEKMQKELGML